MSRHLTFPKIFVFVNGVNMRDEKPYDFAAILEDGTCVAGVCAKGLTQGKYEMGVTSHQKHDVYKRHHPDGYAVTFVSPEEVAGQKNSEFEAAFANALKIDPTPIARRP